ncbi:MAG: hypothetical protein QOE45_2889 [Frankiaceae bacterium]|nr:hypothetical protein [Frankiaceae bacterium]
MQGSNLRPSVLETDALPAELIPQVGAEKCRPAIRRLFTDTSDALGIAWREWARWHISAARRDAVARPDAFVGPKTGPLDWRLLRAWCKGCMRGFHPLGTSSILVARLSERGPNAAPAG